MNLFLYRVYLFFQGIVLDIVELVKHADPFAVLICFIASVAVIFCVDRYMFKKRSVAYILTASIYLTFLISVTILGREPGLNSSWDGLFRTYTEAFSGNAGMRFDILFNVFLYIPIGILVSRNRNDLGNIIFILCLTVIIEFVQLFTGLGVFEISDMINNFVGGSIGLGIARLTEYLHKNRAARKDGTVERAG